jgi:hypothetical protein
MAFRRVAGFLAIKILNTHYDMESERPGTRKHCVKNRTNSLSGL